MGYRELLEFRFIRVVIGVLDLEIKSKVELFAIISATIIIADSIIAIISTSIAILKEDYPKSS